VANLSASARHATPAEEFLRFANFVIEPKCFRMENHSQVLNKLNSIERKVYNDESLKLWLSSKQSIHCIVVVSEQKYFNKKHNDVWFDDKSANIVLSRYLCLDASVELPLLFSHFTIRLSTFLSVNTLSINCSPMFNFVSFFNSIEHF
jgi:hypothetical protein